MKTQIMTDLETLQQPNAQGQTRSAQNTNHE
jgi:hypothetical protein